MEVEYIDKINEKNTNHAKRIVINTLFSLADRICKILLLILNQRKVIGTGFFIKITNNNNKDFYFLVSANHVLTKDIIESEQSIEIITESGKSQEFDKNSRKKRIIKYLKDLDIMAMQILDNDEIIKQKIDFFSCHTNYKEDYNDCYGKDVFILQFPNGGDLEYASGKILDKEKSKNRKKYEFFHSVDTDGGSSGSPIILFENKKVIGVHTGFSFENEYDYNIGAFIGELYKEIIKLIKNDQTIGLKIIDDSGFISEENTKEININNINIEKTYTSNSGFNISLDNVGGFNVITIKSNL